MEDELSDHSQAIFDHFRSILVPEIPCLNSNVNLYERTAIGKTFTKREEDFFEDFNKTCGETFTHKSIFGTLRLFCR